MAQSSLTDLPLEILRNILTFLDAPALLETSRTCHLLRTLSLDPLLLQARLRRARHDLRILLLCRPSRSAISPPNASIWLSRTNVLSRSISKSLVKIRLSHSLERRPRLKDLVERAILPQCCSRVCHGLVSSVLVSRQEEVRKLRLKDKLGKLIERRPSIDRMVEMNIMPAECATGSVISPKLVDTRRRVIKENLKDGLRAWVKSRAIEEQKRKEEEHDICAGGISVKAIVRRFSARRTAAEAGSVVDQVCSEKKQAQIRWGREMEIERRRRERQAMVHGACAQPTRAHVLSLRKFWEGVVQAAAG